MDGRETVGNSLGSFGGLWGMACGKERYGNDDRVDGRETVGNSLGESSGGKERYANDDRVDGRENRGK